jgi:hypothetical protein
MAAIDRYPDDSVLKTEKRDPEYAIDDAGHDSDGVPSFTALIEEGRCDSIQVSMKSSC